MVQKTIDRVMERLVEAKIETLLPKQRTKKFKRGIKRLRIRTKELLKITESARISALDLESEQELDLDTEEGEGDPHAGPSIVQAIESGT